MFACGSRRMSSPGQAMRRSRAISCPVEGRICIRPTAPLSDWALMSKALSMRMTARIISGGSLKRWLASWMEPAMSFGPLGQPDALLVQELAEEHHGLQTLVAVPQAFDLALLNLPQGPDLVHALHPRLVPHAH